MTRLLLHLLQNTKQPRTAAHVVICTVRKRSRIVVRAQDNPLITGTRKLCDHVMGLAIIFLLLYLKPNLLHTRLYQTNGLSGMNGRTEHLFSIPYDGLTQVSLIDIRMRIIHISVLEKNRLCSRLHQILIHEMRHARHIQ